MTTIDSEQLQMMKAAVTVVEVLDEEYYDDYHLPGAINVLLSADFDENI